MYTYLGLQKCEDKALLENGARDVCVQVLVIVDEYICSFET